MINCAPLVFVFCRRPSSSKENPATLEEDIEDTDEEECDGRDMDIPEEGEGHALQNDHVVSCILLFSQY